MSTKTSHKPKNIQNRAPSIIGFKELRENANKYIDAVAKGRSFTVVRRSKPIFNIAPVDEWGDEGVWKTVVDFRDKKGNGIEAGKLLAMLQKMRSNE